MTLGRKERLKIIISLSGRVDPICTEPSIKMLQAHPVSSQSLEISLWRFANRVK